MKNSELQTLSSSVRQKVQTWLDGPYDEETKNEIRRLLKKDPKALEDAFFKDLAFGTGGIRALMGIGTNRLNTYTIARACQGLANYLLLQPKKIHHLRVLIGYDSRHNSPLFAHTCASVLAANDIEVYLLKQLRPTPLVSFGCIYYHCKAAIMITASHNSPEYNGFKVYWDDGAQVLPPHDTGIMSEMEKVKKPSQVKMVGVKHPLITTISSSLDKIYIDTTKSLQNYPKLTKTKGKKLKIIYTNLHGTGITLIPPAFKTWGFSSVHLVAKQKKTDGSFPYAYNPNPEDKAVLALGVEDLMKKKGDLLLATDSDADRVGVAVKHKKDAILFSGNQVACMLLYHLLEAKKNTLPENAAFVKTIVTTELFQEILDHYQKPCINVLTGFKYIAEKIRLWESSLEYHYVFGAEESCGYLAGAFVRDKDAVSTCCLLAELALFCKEQKMTLYDLLLALYKKFGVFREKLITLAFPDTKEGMERVEKNMAFLRKDPPIAFLGKKIVCVQDYLKRESLDIEAKKKTPIALPKSDVILFMLEDKSKIVIRPSGTEPKIKIYIGAQMKRFSSVEKAILETDEYLERLSSSLRGHFYEM